MQMLQQYLGEQGARYATFVLIAIALLIAVLFIWVLIRKALGSRLNFSEKPDRRGRAPRLGITESFNVDREGRRLVIVRRDNFEHLVMIGGPNDVVIETTILRGERLTVGRNDQRAPEPELIPAMPRQITETLQPALSAPLPTPSIQTTPAQKVSVQPAPAPVPPRVAPRQPEPVAPVAAPIRNPVFTPAPVERPPASTVKVEAELKAPEPRPVPVAPSLDLPKAPTVETPPVSPIPASPPQPTTSESVAATAKATVARMLSSNSKAQEPNTAVVLPPIPAVAPVEAQTAIKPVAGKPTLAERIKSGAFFTKKEAASEPPPPPVDVAKIIVDAPRVKLPEVAKPTPSIQPSPTPSTLQPPQNSFAAEMRQLEEAARVVKSPAMSSPANAIPPPTAMPTPPPVVSPAPARPISKNPFDSLEEEMAKLLGRTPEGKG